MNSSAVPSVLIGDEQLGRLSGEGYFLLDGLLGLDGASSAQLAASGQRPAMRPAAIGRGRAHRVDRNSRGDLSVWLELAELPEGFAALQGLFERLQEEANAKVWMRLDDFEPQLACHPGGGAAYERHRDVFRDGAASRRLTAIYYLNANWQPQHGGYLRLFLPSGERDIAPVADRLLVFLSGEVEHELMPALSERWALTAWYSGPRRLPGI